MFGAAPSMQMSGAPYGAAAYGAAPYGADPYGAFNTDKMMQATKMRPVHRTMNIVGLAVALFGPWILFVLAFAMTGFSLHYWWPAFVSTIQVLVFVILALWTIFGLVTTFKRWTAAVELENTGAGAGQFKFMPPDWHLFIASTALLAFIIGCSCGNYEFREHMRTYYDLNSLYTYSNVDPSRMHGQEIMDAGTVSFVPGTHLDISKSMGFKNQEYYCVAPIAGGGAVAGDPPLASYDFWAVGVDCCTSAGGDFACGASNSTTARMGLRAMREDQRSFFRLAVQQAESTSMIKADHPLFFTWVEDGATETQNLQLASYRKLFIAMFVHFLCQLTLMYMAAWFFWNPKIFTDWVN